MARTFGPLSITLPLRTTWEETWQMMQNDGVTPVDLTGYEARMFLLQNEDGDPVAGATPVIYTSEGLTPELSIVAIDGRIDLRVEAEDTKLLSPDNEDRTFAFEVELYIPAGVDAEYVMPLFKGYAAAKARVELL